MSCKYCKCKQTNVSSIIVILELCEFWETLVMKLIRMVCNTLHNSIVYVEFGEIYKGWEVTEAGQVVWAILSYISIGIVPGLKKRTLCNLTHKSKVTSSRKLDARIRSWKSRLKSCQVASSWTRTNISSVGIKIQKIFAFGKRNDSII